MTTSALLSLLIGGLGITVIGLCVVSGDFSLLASPVDSDGNPLDASEIRARSIGMVLYITILSLATLAVGWGLWQERRWATKLGILVFGFLALLTLITLFATPFRWGNLARLLCYGSVAYECWRANREIRIGSKRRLFKSRISESSIGQMIHWKDAETATDLPASELTQINSRDDSDDFSLGDEFDSDYDSSNDQLISLVLLQREPKYLEDIVLARIVESAWGGRYKVGGIGEHEESSAEQPFGFEPSCSRSAGFVSGESPLWIINSHDKMYMVNNYDVPYWDDMESLQDEIHELRLLDAVMKHTAWVSVDFILPSSPESSQDEVYQRIAKLVLELSDESTLALYRPQTSQITVWCDELAERLEAPQMETLFRGDNAPVVRVSGDEPEMIEAIANAKERWPEFVQRFHAHHPQPPKPGLFNIKAEITVDETTEFIWLNVIGLEPNYVHGRLANDPVDLGDMKIDDQVEIPLEDVMDWLYIVEDQTVGAFTVDAIQKITKRRRVEQTSNRDFD